MRESASLMKLAVYSEFVANSGKMKSSVTFDLRKRSPGRRNNKRPRRVP